MMATESAGLSLLPAELVPPDRSYDGQFLLTKKNEEPSLKGAYKLSDWFLSISMQHRPVLVRDKSNRDIGVFIGVVVNSEVGEVVSNVLTVPAEQEDTNFFHQVEAYIYRHTGSWIFILISNCGQRVYLDAGGSLSVVFDPAQRAVGSTTGILLDGDEYAHRFDSEMYNRLQIEQHGWFPAGLTAHQGISRLLVNHYLDLKSFQVVRHWPNRGDLSRTSVDQVIIKIVSVVSGTMKGLVKSGGVVLPLTGGQDSRLILSACRSFAPEIGLFTVAYPGAERDVYLAKEVARIDQRMTHKVISPIRVEPLQRSRWAYNVSHCVGGSNQIYQYSLEEMRGYKYFVSGLGGEVGRAFLWRRTDNEDTSLSARGLIGRFGLRNHPRLEAELNAWLHSLEGLTPFELLDLAYLEHRVSAWAYAQSYAYQGVGHILHVSPLVSRSLFSMFLGLPPAERIKASYMISAIRAEWPELMKIPINEYGDWRDWMVVARKIINPALVRKKIRKIFAAS